MAVKKPLFKVNEAGHHIHAISAGTVVFREPTGRDLVQLETSAKDLPTNTEVTAALAASLMVSWLDQGPLTAEGLLDLPLSTFKEVASCLESFQDLL